MQKRLYNRRGGLGEIFSQATKIFVKIWGQRCIVMNVLENILPVADVVELKDPPRGMLDMVPAALVVNTREKLEFTVVMISASTRLRNSRRARGDFQGAVYKVQNSHGGAIFCFRCSDGRSMVRNPSFLDPVNRSTHVFAFTYAESRGGAGQ